MSALRSALALFPTPIKDREFLGRRIYTLTLPDLTGSGSPASFTSPPVADTSRSPGRPGPLRSTCGAADTKPKPLADTPGLREAAQKVGGTGTGLFGFQNDAEQIRPYWDAVRTNPGLFFSLATAQNPALEGPWARIRRNSRRRSPSGSTSPSCPSFRRWPGIST
ncbi:MAG: hypothetical protein M5U12_21155 [Verrucomicrobia bacterium]|nr:hypothetical protein [Verrucomicrobiota bacterium]